MTQQQPKKQPKQPKPAKKKPLGPALSWTDDDLDLMSEISPADLKAAGALWENEAPKPLKNLLQAQVEEEDKPK